MTIAGRIDFNPITDSLIGADGKPFKLSDPSAAELPVLGFDAGEDTYQVQPLAWRRSTDFTPLVPESKVQV
jgi:aconitate hydratase